MVAKKIPTDDELQLCRSHLDTVFKYVQEGTIPYRQTMDGLQRLMSRRGRRSNDLIEVISIPNDATAESLIAECQEEFQRAKMRTPHFDQKVVELIRQDLELVRGKTLQVFIHKFIHGWGASECRDLQKKEGSDGNAAGHVVLATMTHLPSHSYSIPNENARLACLDRNDDRNPCVLSFSCTRRNPGFSGYRTLRLRFPATEYAVSFKVAA